MPWTLRAWHNLDPMVDDLSRDPTHAILEVGYIDHAESRLEQRQLPDGVYIGATHNGFQKLLRGERLPLPAT